MADQKRRGPLPPLYSIPEVQHGGHPGSVREIKNPAYVEAEDMQQNRKVSIPLPDYETLFPQKRHGVQGQTRWDHIVAEVNQRNIDLPPELLGPEMSVDGPQQDKPSTTFSKSQEITEFKPYQTHPVDNRPPSSKKVPAPGPPKPERLLIPQTDSSSSATQNNSHQSDFGPNPQSSKSSGSSDPRKMLDSLSALTPTPALLTPKQSNQETWDTSGSANQNQSESKDPPLARVRQKFSVKEQVPTNKSGTDKIDSFAEFDPFPTSELLSKDPWEDQKENVQNRFTASVPKEQKPEDRGMTPDDLDKIFSQEKTSDPFTSINLNESSKQSPYSHKDDVSKQFSEAFQRKNSQRGKKTPPSTPQIDSKTSSSPRGPSSPAPRNGTKDKKQSRTSESEDPFGTKPFATFPAQSSSHVTEEPTSPTGGLSGRKTLLQAWVSPSEVQSVSTQNSSEGGLGLSARRPHPVKPLSSDQSHHPIGSPAVKETKVLDFKSGNAKVPSLTQTGPYSQLTQEELITLVVKQQTDLSVKHAKIVELEEYIDNLLVRVIDEHPGILQSLSAPKPV